MPYPPEFVPPGESPDPDGREIAVRFPYSGTAVALRKRAAPRGRFDYDRSCWIFVPEEARALVGAAIAELSHVIASWPDIPAYHTGKRGQARAQARELVVFLNALGLDGRVWTAELREDARTLVADIRAHRTATGPEDRLL
jgi:hypothetical protein